MKIGERVELVVIGDARAAARGKVVLASEDGTNMAVLFSECPPFGSENGYTGAHGYLLALRKKPDDRWEDPVSEKAFEVRVLQE